MAIIPISHWPRGQSSHNPLCTMAGTRCSVGRSPSGDGHVPHMECIGMVLRTEEMLKTARPRTPHRAQPQHPPTCGPDRSCGASHGMGLRGMGRGGRWFRGLGSHQGARVLKAGVLPTVLVPTTLLLCGGSRWFVPGRDMVSRRVGRTPNWQGMRLHSRSQFAYAHGA